MVFKSGFKGKKNDEYIKSHLRTPWESQITQNVDNVIIEICGSSTAWPTKKGAKICEFLNIFELRLCLRSLKKINRNKNSIYKTWNFDKSPKYPIVLGYLAGLCQNFWNIFLKYFKNNEIVQGVWFFSQILFGFFFWTSLKFLGYCLDSWSRWTG